MHERAGRDFEYRVLVLPPTARDGETARNILTDAGLSCIVCPDVGSLCREFEEAGAGAVVLTEEATAVSSAGCLADTLREQPPWSDLPVIVLTRGGASSPAALRALESLGNVTLLERPVRVLTLVSAVRTALRARARQYQTLLHLEERRQTEERLREADRRKDEFLAMLAHELRNPLAAINGAAQVARRSATEEDRDWSQEVIERHVHHLARLIDDLMDVSRITRGKIELRKVPVDIGAAVRRAVDSSMSLIDSRGHRLDVAVAQDLPPVEADPTRLEQILGNLLTNAAKYTDDGGRIELTAERDADDVVLRVRDTGVGIPAEMIPHLFELFVQGDRSIDRSQGGLGIGLTIVRKLAEMHGGSVSVASEGPRKGSTFTLRLPALLGTIPGPTAPPASAEGGKARGSRVLVVDDNVDSAQGVSKLLRLLGHDVRCAYDGPSALELARDFRPGVVLLDIGLPGMDGCEVARRIRRVDGLEGILLVAVTGYGEDRAQRRSEAAGFNHHLVKPLNLDTLVELVAKEGPVSRGR